MRALRNSHCRTYWTAACTALALVACFLVLPAWAAPRCTGMAATIVGTSGADTIKGTSGSDVIVGRKGHDTINGLGGNDRVCGGRGNDTIVGADGSDVIGGGHGNDTLNAWPHLTVNLQLGNDTFK